MNTCFTTNGGKADRSQSDLWAKIRLLIVFRMRECYPQDATRTVAEQLRALALPHDECGSGSRPRGLVLTAIVPNKANTPRERYIGSVCNPVQLSHFRGLLYPVAQRELYSTSALLPYSLTHQSQYRFNMRVPSARSIDIAFDDRVFIGK